MGHLRRPLSIVLVSMWLGALAASAEAKTVLWDTSHGTYLDFDINGEFSELGTTLQAMSYSVAESSEGLQDEDLTDVDLVVVAVTSAWDSTYSDFERLILADFVEDGGALLVLCDDPSSPNDHLEAVLEPFGVTCAASSANENATTWLDGHPVSDGVNTLHLSDAGVISVESQAVAIGYDEAGLEPLVAVSSLGRGRVAVIGDVDWASNALIHEDDNEVFAQQLINWLTSPCVPLVDVRLVDSGCTDVGVEIWHYCDLDESGEVSSNEVFAEEMACVGGEGDLLVNIDPTPPNVPCESGGYLLSIGRDGNGDGVLEDAEVEREEYICNGLNGTAGMDGRDGMTHLVNLTEEPSGPNCAFGGIRVDEGTDQDGDGRLSPFEYEQTQFVCSGKPGRNGGCDAGGVSSLAGLILVLFALAAPTYFRRTRKWRSTRCDAGSRGTRDA